jgi:glutathione S-transferase
VPTDKRGVTGYGSFDLVMDTVELAVSKSQYVLGDEFSTVDVYLGSQLGWGLQFGTIPMRPAFEKYCNNLKERPAAIRAARIDDEIRAKQLLG